MINHVGEVLGKDFGINLMVDYEEKLRNNSFIIHTTKGISYIHKTVDKIVSESEKFQYQKGPIYKSSIEHQDKVLTFKTSLNNAHDDNVNFEAI